MRGIQDAAGGGQRVHGGVDADLGQRALQSDGGVQVGEGGHRGRVRVVIGRHVDGLEARDGAALGGRDALLELAHLVGQGRLVAHGRRHAPEQRRHLGAGHHEAVDVVDEEENVLALLIAKVLGVGQRSVGDAGANTGRLVHLAKDQDGLVDDAGLVHLDPQLIALTGTLTDAAKDRHAAVLQGDVADELHDDKGLADAGAAEHARLAALGERCDQVDDLDARLKHVGGGLLLLKGRRGPVDRVVLVADQLALAVDGLAQHVEQTAKRGLADRDHDRRACVHRAHSAAQAIGGIHGDAAHPIVAQMLLHLQHEAPAVLRVNIQRVVDLRKVHPTGTLRQQTAPMI